MSPWLTIKALLPTLFDSNELRTLCSTPLYLGDLSAHLPPPGCPDDELHQGVLEGLASTGRLGPALFRTLYSLRPHQRTEVSTAERHCRARKVLVIHGGVDHPDHAEQQLRDARLAERLTVDLQRLGHRIMTPWPSPPPHAGPLVLHRGLEDCDALLLLLSAASSAAPSTAQALERSAARCWPAILVVTTDATMPPPVLLSFLGAASVHPCVDNSAYSALIDAVGSQLDALMPQALLHAPQRDGLDPWPPPRGGGAGNTRPAPVSRQDLKAVGQPGETIFQELLVHPLEVTQDQGRTMVTVDRRGVDQLVLTTAAKAALWTEKLGSRAGLHAGEAWDAWFEARLEQRRSAVPPQVPCPALRWGGAGVLAVIRWRGDDWIPLLFRDIPPVGWNLPLGASSRGDDFDDPRTWGRRELLEELIVLQGAPSHGQPIALRPLLLPDTPTHEGQRAAVDAALQTLALRARYDRLPVVAGSAPIVCRGLPTPSDLTVRSDAGTRRHRNLITAPVPLELGIDVVELMRFELGDDDNILDGEVLERDDGSLELVRMPVAMFRASALRSLFGPGAAPLSPTDTLPRSLRCDGLQPEDLHLFPWDVGRRVELARGTRMGDSAIDPRERERYRSWLDRLGRHFLDSEGRPSAADPCLLFVGATARLLGAWAHGKD